MANSNVFVAAIGNDGFRPVVWGIGQGSDWEEAQAAAKTDAGDWLDGVDDPQNATIEFIKISAERFGQIKDGNVAAMDLVCGFRQ